MAHLTMADLASRSGAVADEKRDPKKWKPGGRPGKLHSELGIPKDEKIPAARLESATHSSNPEVKRDAIRAKTMAGWNHAGSRKDQLAKVYDHGSRS
jgi:hypothetical protein